jgi:hypothetical protein
MLTIVSATNLVDVSYLGIGSDPYCIIFLRSQRNGGSEIEIYRTNICEQSSNAFFNKDYCSFQVPVDDGIHKNIFLYIHIYIHISMYIHTRMYIFIIIYIYIYI